MCPPCYATIACSVLFSQIQSGNVVSFSSQKPSMCLHLLKTDTVTQSPDVAVLVMIDLSHFRNFYCHLSVSNIYPFSDKEPSV